MREGPHWKCSNRKFAAQSRASPGPETRAKANAGLDRAGASVSLLAKGAHLAAIRGEVRPVALLSVDWEEQALARLWLALSGRAPRKR